MSDRKINTDFLSKPVIVVVLVLAVVGTAAAATYLNNSVSTSGEVPVSAASAPTGAVTGGVDVNMTSFSDANGDTRIRTSGGNVTLSGPSSGYVRLDTIEGTWTNTSKIDPAGGTVTINPDDKQQADVAGSIDRLHWKHSMTADDGKVDFVYGGASGSSTVTFYNLPASTELAAIDSDNNSVLDVQTSDANGVATFSMPNSDHDVTLQTQDGQPQVTNVKPTGNLSTAPDKISADINDSDFPEDNVTVYMYWNGTLEGTQSVKSNGSVSAALSSNPNAGQHTVKVAAEDSFGDWTNKSTTFQVPDTLYIYDELHPSSLIKNSGTVEVTFYANDEVIKRTTSDGTVNLEGLPVDQRIAISASVTDYHERRTTIESLYQQQEVYLLNKTEATESDVVYSLNDQTGDYEPGKSLLFVKKPLTKDYDGDGTTETRYQTITSDTFGATNEMPTTLQNDARYRLYVENTEDSVRDVGHYTVTGSASETIKLGTVNIPIDGDKTTTFNTEVKEINGHRYLRIAYADPTKETTELTWNITRRSNGSVVEPDTTISQTLGTYSALVNISQYSKDTALIVNYETTRNGEVSRDKNYVGGVASIFGTLSIDPRWLSLIGFVGLVAITGLVTISDPTLAAVTGVSVATLFTWIGVFSIPPAALGVAGVVAILFAIGRQ